jgi:hypothetical protein
VPAWIVRRKAVEGAVKGVPPERIATAVEAWALRLGEARGALGASRTPQTVAAGAEALRKGLPPAAMAEFARSHAGERDLSVPLFVLGDLSEAGVPTDRAVEAVNGAWERGIRGEGMIGLGSAVRRRVRRGEDPVRALEQVRTRAFQRMRDGMGPGMGVAPRGSGRPLDRSPVPPGSNPPRMGDGDAGSPT